MQLRYLALIIALVTLTSGHAVIFEWDIAVQGGTNTITDQLVVSGSNTVDDPISFQNAFARRLRYTQSSTPLGCSGEVSVILETGITTDNRAIPGSGADYTYQYPALTSALFQLTGITPTIGAIGNQQSCSYELDYRLEVAIQQRRISTTITAADGIKPLGQIGPLASTQLQQGEEFVVISRNPQALVWVGTPQTRGTLTTTDAGFTVYACEDLNQDRTCDNTIAQTGSTNLSTNTSSGFIPTTTVQPPPRPGTNKTLRPLDFMRIATNGTSQAQWSASLLKFTMDSVVGNAGFCKQDSQCLITAEGNDAADGNLAAYFTNTQSTSQPKCADDGQSILEHICRNGQWRSRASELFVSLASVGEQSGSDYSISCSQPEDVFNDITYITSQQVPATQFIGQECNPYNSGQAYPCINNACVYQGINGIGFAVSLNVPLNDPNGFLATLNLSNTFCDNVQGSNTYYEECSPGQLSGERLYYNPYSQTLILLENDVLPTIDLNQDYQNVIISRYQDFQSYVNNNINAPDLDKGYFTRPQTFEHIGLTKAGNKEVFGYKNTDKTQFRYDYTGFRYTNINLGQNSCSGFIKQFDTKAYCEQQPTPGTTYVIGQSLPGNRTLSSAWLDMTSKIRP